MPTSSMRQQSSDMTPQLASWSFSWLREGTGVRFGCKASLVHFAPKLSPLAKVHLETENAQRVAKALGWIRRIGIRSTRAKQGSRGS